jgi:hypothetical protein
MVLPALFERFVADAPLSVMARALLERALQPEPLDRLFQENATGQYHHELLFSSVVDLLSRVALRLNRSVRQAYLTNPHYHAVAVESYYGKLNRMEPQLGPALVRHSARHLAEVISALGGVLPPWRPGYRVKVLDGNHLSGSQRRLKVLRATAAAALPGQVLAVLDPRQRLFLDLIPCEDAYTQERALLAQVLPQVEANDVWVADRNFCTPKFLTGIDQRGACFAIREHAQLNIRYLGALQAVGRSPTGMVFEQEAVVTDDETGASVGVRRVVVQLDRPTRDGDTEVAVLTNLPAAVADACAVAALYLERWTIEVAFGALTVVLRCEVETLGYPRAALFSFAVAVLAANLLGAVQAALGSVHGPHTVAAELSVFQVATDIAGTYKGMMIALPAAEWQVWGRMSLAEFVAALRSLAEGVNWELLQKGTRGPKKPPVKKPSASKQRHVSTHRLLMQAKEARKQAKASQGTPSQP